EVLNLCARLHEEGRTVTVVLHDLNQAARYATHLVVMSHGKIVAQGDPTVILTTELIQNVFGLATMIIHRPRNGNPPRHSPKGLHPPSLQHVKSTG
ncbi:hypothetical protein JF66_15590, partial [Cryobacterium sp. MLB-32]